MLSAYCRSWARADEMIRNGAQKIEVICIEITDENLIMNLVVDLNKTEGQNWSRKAK